MPIRFRSVGTEGLLYENVFVGPTDHTVQLRVNLAVLTSAEIDARGFLKPGIPFTKAGVLPGAGAFVYGVTVEEVQVANAPFVIANLGWVYVAVANIAMVNQKLAEDVLGRVLTANEITAFDAAGSKVVLIPKA
jgi:hypothetical protein